MNKLKQTIAKSKSKVLKNGVSSPRFRATHVPAASALLQEARLNIETGTAFQRLRQSVHVTRAELSRRTGYCAGYIFALERGRCRWRDELVETFIRKLQECE